MEINMDELRRQISSDFNGLVKSMKSDGSNKKYYKELESLRLHISFLLLIEDENNNKDWNNMSKELKKLEVI